MGERIGQRVGLMGGTFDPIHNGHLVAAEEARVALKLERVLFIPAGRPWQKERPSVSSADHRLAMTKLATADNDEFEVSGIEIEREGPTYTIDTLRTVGEEHPGAELHFITGADATLEILTWKDPEEALKLATFVAVTRPGHDLGKLASLGYRDRIVVLEIPALAISSTDIRRRVAEGRPIRYLVPESVRLYIDEKGLYRA
jgi:nicotinate-nucleotide adenylyltransferase